MKSMYPIQETRIGKAISLLNGFIILGFSATLISIPQAHWWFGFFALFAAVVACAVMAVYKKFSFGLNNDDYKLVAVLVFFGGIWWLSVFTDGSLPLIVDAGLRHLYLWPFIAALFLITLRVFTPAPDWLWLGVCCGGASAGLIAIYERVVVGLSRADNGINAIPFGNLSLLMGALSLVACVYYIQKRPRFHYGLILFAMCAAFLGLLASLLSGTRGGWIAIPFLAALLFSATNNLIKPKTRNISIIVVALFVVAIIAFPASGIWLRIVAIFDDIYQYFINNNADTSLGTRFELWRAGWSMFIENPIMGVGESGVQENLPSLVAREIAFERGSVLPQLHSDIIDTLARRGLLGAASLLLMYVVFASTFAKKALKANDKVNVRLLAVSGMMVIIAFFDFGLSQSMFRDLRAFSGFLGFSVAIWGCLGHQLHAQSSLSASTMFMNLSSQKPI
jgi:O-antigen ligase